MTLRQLIDALTIRMEWGEGDFEVFARDEHGALAPVRLVSPSPDLPKNALGLDAWEKAA